MRELGGSRYIIKPSTHSTVDDLYDASPNFAEVIDDLRKFLALAVAGNEAVQFTPILLGEPGLGKTWFAKKLSQALSTGFEFVSMSSLTAGCDRRVGAVAERATRQDRAGADRGRVCEPGRRAGRDRQVWRRPPLRSDGRAVHAAGTDTAASFKDEFIDVDMDASHILWIATANDDSAIPSRS